LKEKREVKKKRIWKPMRKEVEWLGEVVGSNSQRQSAC
jgi:hypothetical protein